jgi:hypothetical protein
MMASQWCSTRLEEDVMNDSNYAVNTPANETNVVPVYTCPKCGHHDFKVEFTRSIIDKYEDTVPCSCSLEEDYAWVRTYENVQRVMDSGWLDEYHDIDWDFTYEKLDDNGYDTLDEHIACHACAELNYDLIETEHLDVEEDDGGEWLVRCGKCDEEIPFGWSHPHRGGRIWPVHSTDFEDGRSWMEERYQQYKSAD